MSLQLQSWIVFGLSFLASAGLLGLMFISRAEIQYLMEWIQIDGGSREQESEASETQQTATGGGGETSWADYVVDVDAEEEDDEEDEDEDDDEDDDEEEEAGEEEVKDSRKGLMTFLEGSLAGMVKGGFQLDSINKFGCHLFLAGACETQARKTGLNHDQFVELLAKSIGVLGSSASVAHKFGEKYEEYLLEPRYAEMFKAGGNAMEQFLAGGDDGAESLSSALEVWSNPDKANQESDALMAVLFTDIIGSTKMNQKHGDAAAQRVVHDHNSIVRAALQNNAGTEVKHTGDGIMASFTSSTKAVEAGIEMIKSLKFRNSNEPEVPLHLRVGINAGQPIAEGGDLFGTTVQVAAQLCDEAKTDGVCVSQVVRELCAGKDLKFDSMGEVTIKGIGEPTTLFNVKISS